MVTVDVFGYCEVKGMAGSVCRVYIPVTMSGMYSQVAAATVWHMAAVSLADNTVLRVGHFERAP